MGQEHTKAVALATDSKHFEVTNTELSDLPYPALRSLKKVDLHTICLSDNKIQSISKPLKILAFSDSLTKLDLSSNGLREVPVALAFLPQLTYLSLSFNLISILPEEMPTNLMNLECLILYNNRIRALPRTFHHLQKLKVCVSMLLRQLCAQTNRFSQLHRECELLGYLELYP
jgi:Leucine-rich repeat (LRR) protein